MKNYICINGKVTELTAEQMRQLGIETENPFEECNKGEKYHYIDTFGIVRCDTEQGMRSDDRRYAVANYCTDKSMMEQRALHETLSRLLWRFSMEHSGDEIDWENPNQTKFEICYTHDNDSYYIEKLLYCQDIDSVYFASHEAANKAIKEIVEPFIEAHPDFEW